VARAHTSITLLAETQQAFLLLMLWVGLVLLWVLAAGFTAFGLPGS